MSQEKTFTCFALTECFENKFFSQFGKQAAPFYDNLKGQGKIAFRVGNSISGRLSAMNGDKEKFHAWICDFQSTPMVTVNGVKVATPMTEKQIVQWIIDNPSEVNEKWSSDERCIKALNDVLGGTKVFSVGQGKAKAPAPTPEQMALLQAMLEKGMTPEQIATMTI
jgi:hypothetical protein